MPLVLAHVLSAALHGVEAALVRVEVDVTPGLPAFTTVGLPDSAVRESRERVRTAIRNAGFAFPSDRITVNLAPAGLRKEGASFDLPIALGILAASGQLPMDKLAWMQDLLIKTGNLTKAVDVKTMVDGSVLAKALARVGK